MAEKSIIFYSSALPSLLPSALPSALPALLSEVSRIGNRKTTKGEHSVFFVSLLSQKRRSTSPGAAALADTKDMPAYAPA